MSVIKALYVFAAVCLAVYGIQAIILCIVSLWPRREAVARPPVERWPYVTIQLPVYNELYVADRLLHAIVRMIYPRDRLEIQILDDSTDETTEVLEREAARYRQAGLNVRLLHRAERHGFKAGALKTGLELAGGELIAIFDADFLPPADFLLRTVPYFAADERLGLVQTRWGHINARCSTLTQAQGLALDAHFMVEQFGRQRNGLFMSFNGTAGVWRKEAILSSGGWAGDTLCEDLDLSYRAQMAGWRALFLPEVETPAELPPQMAALKRQQARWAQGSVQCLLKLGRALLTSPASWPARLMGIGHLCAYGIHPSVLLLFLCTLPLLWHYGEIHIPILTYLSLASFGPTLAQILGQRALHKDWPRRLLYLPFLLLLGTGLSWQNSVAVFKALLGRPAEFLRTPKFKVRPNSRGWEINRYALGLDRSLAGEALLMVYAAVTILVAIRQGNYAVVPFMSLYLCGFAYVGLYDVWQRWRLTVQRERTSRLAPAASE